MSLYKCVLPLLIISAEVANYSDPLTKTLTNVSASVKIQERVSVRIDDLPEAVRNVVKSGKYEGWKVTDAYRTTRDDKSQYYELAISREEESTKINVDKNGQIID